MTKRKDFDFFKATDFTKQVHFGLHSNNETTQKTNYFEKFIEEFDFVELSTQAKHLRVWILHGD